MIKDGEAESALVGPWTMGRDKKNPKPLDFDTFAHLCVTAISQRRPVRPVDLRWLGVHPNVLQYLPDIGAVSKYLGCGPSSFARQPAEYCAAPC